MSFTTIFAGVAKKRRLALGDNLRTFCEKSGFDQGNLSKIERGLMPPPMSTLSRYADALGLESGSEEREHFEDLAVLSNRMVPADILDDPACEELLPEILMALRRRKVFFPGAHGTQRSEAAGDGSPER